MRSPTKAREATLGRRPRIKAAFALAFAAALTGPFAHAGVSGVPSVTDRDTLEIRGVAVRLHGIDAPESSQRCYRPSGKAWRCGQKAALALADKIGRAPVRCEGEERDRYGRLIGTCYSDGEDLNAWMVANGWAVAYRRYSRDYVDEERKARQRGAGIWQGEFVMPWKWRRGERVGGASGAGSVGRDRECGDFSSQRQAQRFYQRFDGDPHRLDGNEDGEACEGLQ